MSITPAVSLLPTAGRNILVASIVATTTTLGAYRVENSFLRAILQQSRNRIMGSSEFVVLFYVPHNTLHKM